MTQTFAVQHLSVTINRDWRDVYDFTHRPANFAQWASGLGSSLSHQDGLWIAATPAGPATVQFSPVNEFGVLDHTVAVPGQGETYNPMRVVANGSGAEMIFTLFRRPGVTDAEFARDAEWVMRDLTALKQLLEASPDSREENQP